MGRGAILAGARRAVHELRGTVPILSAANNVKDFHAATEHERVRVIAEHGILSELELGPSSPQ